MRRYWVLAMALTWTMHAALSPAAPVAAPPRDLSTPKGVLREMAAAVDAGDARTIRSILLASDPTEQRLAQAMAEMAGVLADLRRQAVAQFGPNGARDLIGDPAARAVETADKLKNAEERIDADTATVTSDDGVTVLRKVDGQWRLPVSEMVKGTDPAALAKTLEELEAQAKIFRETTAEMAAGKYTTADAAAQALHAKMLASTMERLQSATQPATQATTRP